MKKSTMKVLSLVMALAMIMGTLSALPFSANALTGRHVHTPSGDPIETVEPTCGLYGYSVYRCECGQTFIDDITEKLEHDYQEVGEIPATCAEPGYTAGIKCAICGDVLEGCEKIDNAHTVAYRIVDFADCLDGVIYEKYCKECGKVLEENVNTLVDEKYHDLKAEILQAPTCSEEGLARVYCANEGVAYFEDCTFEAAILPIKKLDHTPSERKDWVDNEGKIIGWYIECTVCGVELAREQFPEDPVVETCKHESWTSIGYSFAYASNPKFSSKDFEGTAEEYMTEYAKYSDISDLYELFVCSNPACNAQKMELKLERTGHVYGDYTFKFTGYVKVKEGLKELGYEQEFKVDLVGGRIETTYMCEEPVQIDGYCAICMARAENLNEDYEPEDLSDPEEIMEHNYDGWICQNEGCKNNQHFVIGQETYYECTNCMHNHAEDVCLNLVGTLIEYTDFTIVVEVDYTKVDETGDESLDKFVVTYPEVGERDAVDNRVPCFYEDIESIVERFATKDHKLGDTIYTMPGTCVDLSYTYKLCTVCETKEVLSFGAKDPNNHDFSEWGITKAPTCYTEGVEKSVCGYGCGKIESRAVAIDPEAHPDGAWIPFINPITGEEVVKPANCASPAQRVIICQYCDLTDIEDVPGSEPLPTDNLDNHIDYIFAGTSFNYNQKAFKHLYRAEATCTTEGRKEFEYCSLCGTYITIAGEDVFQNQWNYFTNPEYVIIPALGHDFVTAAGIEPDCFNAGQYPLVKCNRAGCEFNKGFTVNEVMDLIENEVLVLDFSISGLAGNFRLNGAARKAYKHDKIAEKKLVEGDELSNDPYVVEIYINDVDFIAKQYALSTRARDVEPIFEEDVTIGFAYYLDWVEPTCKREGYIVGKYCLRCAEVYGNDDLFFEEAFNFTGYRIAVLPHDYIEYEFPMPEELSCDEEAFSYTIKYCVACREVVIDNYDYAKADTHEAELDGENEKIYTVVLGVDGYVELTEGLEELYPDCEYARFEAKKCIKCGFFFDVTEKEAAKGHYKGDVALEIECDKYDKALAGAVCDACGKKLVRVEYEKDDNGLDKEVYYNQYGVVIPADKLELYDILIIVHEWADEQEGCEGADARIRACARCGINVINEDYEEGDREHQYIIRETFAEEGTVEPFVLADYDMYAFDDVVYPTATTIGYGYLTCVVCGEQRYVEIPVFDALASVEFDTDGIVLVGNEITATIRVTTKDFTFREIDLAIFTGEDDVVKLDRVELLGEFSIYADVVARINADGNVVIRAKGIEDAVISGDNVECIKLIFKTGDLTDKQEITERPIAIYDVRVTRTTDGDLTTEAEVAGNPFKLVNDTFFEIVKIYNPAYTESAVGSVLAQIFDTYSSQYDFNRDGLVDFDDYFMMIDFIDGEQTIADFCALVNYDIEAMLDSLDYRMFARMQKFIVTDVTTIITGREYSEEFAKQVIREELETTNYFEIAGEKTIAEFAEGILLDLMN